MNNDLLKYISEYFNAFPKEDYTIYVNGTPTKWCGLNINNNRVAYKLSALNPIVPCGVIYDSVWYAIYSHEIKEVSMTVTTMVIKKTNGKEYTFTAKIKEKEEKVNDLLLKAENILLNYLWTSNKEKTREVMEYLCEIKALMNK